jgi:phenylpropionate dioxygenase-like ring-hydroxylating dioxygenase large terminal subunit
MRTYRSDSHALRGLVEAGRVHRDLYLSEELFALERERLFRRAWVFVGHASQVPKAGDYFTTEIAGEPIAIVRAADGSLAALLNRCAHKGATVLSDEAGNTGRALRCPYHSWSYRLDGSLLAIPVPAGYDGTGMRECETGHGLGRVATATYRGFIFVRLAGDDVAFDAHCGPVLHCLDALADRSPEGELEVAGAPLRNVIRCNWKIYLENVNDTLHANVTHESAAIAAEQVWNEQPAGTPRPAAIEQLLPFGSGNDFMAQMGAQVFAHGHSVLGVNLSIHSAYSALPEYEAAMVRAYGAELAQQILSWIPQNAILYPSIAFKSAPQTLRVIRPLAVDRTLVEAWAFRPKGAPQALVERTLLYNRMVFSPMSMVAHDDSHVFETIQRALRASANEWVSLHRELAPDEYAERGVTMTGTNEILMRNQYRAWVELMRAQEGEAS